MIGFEDRSEAGKQLAEKLSNHLTDTADTLVLALPRGGVPVASEVAKLLGAPLDVLLVRKLGTPHNPELAFGAIAEGGASSSSIREPLTTWTSTRSRLPT